MAADTSSPVKPVRWFSRRQLVILFWIGAIITVVVMASTGPVGWDAQIYWKAIQFLRHDVDPYAAGIAAQQAFQNRPVSSAPAHVPFTYVYSPLTLPLLRLLGALPDWLLGVLWAAAVAAGFLLQLWACFQMAAEHERPFLALMLPSVAYFPGLITDDVILSGNVAYVLYGLALAAAVPGWRRGRWFWFYVAVLAASIFKAPLLTLLAFPVVVGRRQWVPAASTAAAGLLLIAAQARLWPELFREYLLAVRLVFDEVHDFGFGPAGVLGKALWKVGRPYSLATILLYVAFASALGILLLFLARRVRQKNLSREAWIPVALVGTFLLNPRIMKYDMAAITIPMLLIGWRTLRFLLKRPSGFGRIRVPEERSRLAQRFSAGKSGEIVPSPGGTTEFSHTLGSPGQNHFNLALILVGAACFLVPNSITVAGPPWSPVELVVMLTVFAMGVSSLNRSQSEIQLDAQPARAVCEEVGPVGKVRSNLV